MKGVRLLLTTIVLIISCCARSTAQTVLFDTLYQRANQERNAGAYDKAIAGYQQCLTMATSFKDSLRIGNSLIGIGISNDEGGRFEEALQYYFKALDVYEKIGNSKKAGGTLKNICQTTLINPRTDKKVLKTFQDAKLGLFVHWMACFTPATGDSWDIGRKTSKRTADSISLAWDPEKFDAKAIVDFAVNAGCRYITVVAKHHDGFCIWDSKYTDFDVKRTKFKRDILAELEREAHRRGLLYGIYYSIADIHQCGWDEMPSADAAVPEPGGGKKKFVTFIHDQVKELIKNYSPDILWFDGYWLEQYWTREDGKELYADIKKTKSALLSRGLSSTRDAENKQDIFIPDGSSGDYLCIEAKTSQGPDYPWEACTSVSYPVYAYDPNAKLMSRKELIAMFDKDICGNGNFLLNIGPDRDGSLPEPLTSRFMEMSRWVLKNKEAVYNTSGGPFKQSDSLGSTYKDDKIYLHIRKDVPVVNINGLKGYKILSGRYITTGRELSITETPTGYAISDTALHGDDGTAGIIEIKLNKKFVFTNWIDL